MFTTRVAAAALAIWSAGCAGHVHAADTSGDHLADGDVVGCWERVDRYLDLVQGGLTLCMTGGRVQYFSFGISRIWERDGVKLTEPLESMDGSSGFGSYTLKGRSLTLHTDLWFEERACTIVKTNSSLILTDCYFQGEYFLECQEASELYCKGKN